ncbi:MAG: hypothetical protein C0622_08920 [Desulfuromonas sp.]|nr:MAG: hypothetical protein C0622_08920 [Desulfuromonas sp.]
MSGKSKKLSNAFSTGSGGSHFEAHVQSSFVALLLSCGYAPCLPCWPISEIKLQGKVKDFDTDDLIVFVENQESKESRKLLGQIKHSISFTEGNSTLGEVIQAAWNDFNNPKIFTKGKDVICLITGPLSATDARNVVWLLDQARHTKSVEEFLAHVNQANFSPSKSAEKLGVIRFHLKAANNGVDVTDNVLYEFLNNFYLLGYDLGKEVGVVLSLLHSHIAQFNHKYPQWVWSRVVDIVQTWNQDAGTITQDKMPEDLIEAFKLPAVSHIPTDLTTPEIEATAIDWNQHHHATVLALANLIGGWDENNPDDVKVLESLSGEGYSSWVVKVREILNQPNSPLTLKNGIWKVASRVDLWHNLGPRIFDQNLDVLKDSVVTVFREKNPSFELPVDERYAASVHGKDLAFSPTIRKSLADSIAILGSYPDALLKASLGKAEATAVLAIREIFADADWKLWGSLNQLLPTLAEAAPGEFLVVVETALNQSPCPFDDLFAQEGTGVTGSNYLTGLLWALENLAWAEDYLVRTCALLGELACHDPGGNWANRPSNSISTILLPWFPQTAASVEKRKVTVQTLVNESPDIAWKLLVSLLPNQHQTTSGSHKPTWRQFIPTDWEDGVTKGEYREQVSFYAELAVNLASQHIDKLAELIDHFDDLPNTAFDQLLQVLSSKDIISRSEDEVLRLWERLSRFVQKHRRYSDAKWALKEELLSQIEAVGDKLAPSNPFNKYQYLFSHNDFDLYDDDGDDWREQERKLEERRQNAIREILDTGGLSAVVSFAQEVEHSGHVGHSLGGIADKSIDVSLLPDLLSEDKSKLAYFVGSYIWSRHHLQGWEWAESLDRTTWSVQQVANFLSCLRFCSETWQRVPDWLGENENMYWTKTNANPYQAKDDLEFAIKKLLGCGRPLAAIDCLFRMKYEKERLDVNLCVQALMDALSTSEPSKSMDAHHMVEISKTLQDDPKTPQKDLFKVEWAYLRLLDRYHKAEPKLLEHRLASEPEFFCEVIRLIYRSKKATEDEKDEVSEEQKAFASNAWRLLHHWGKPPGTQSDGSFDENSFIAWVERVKEICTESGHLEVAMLTAGEVLIHCPPDKNGLWINKEVANVLNAKDSDGLRRGFSTGTYNSRGVHWVDPSGKPEKELAAQYKKKAEDVENAGFHRFAVTLRAIAEGYEKESAWVIDRHKEEFPEE